MKKMIWLLALIVAGCAHAGDHFTTVNGIVGRM